MEEDRCVLADVVKSYEEYLCACHPGHFRPFKELSQRDPEAATGEALVFAMAWDFRLNPRPAGPPGPDFSCEPKRFPSFYLEATSISSQAAAEESEVRTPLERGSCGSFSFITQLLQSKVIDKADQLANLPYARVLAITLMNHHMADTLLGPKAAENLLTSDPKIAVPLGEADPDFKQITELEESVFFRFNRNKAGAVEPCRQSISAVLLVPIFNDRCFLVGLLHPEPAARFDNGCMPTVPFLQVRNWPLKTGQRIETDWILGGNPVGGQVESLPLTYKRIVP